MAKFKITNSDQGHNYIHYVEAIDRQAAIDTFKAWHYGTIIDCEEVKTATNKQIVVTLTNKLTGNVIIYPKVFGSRDKVRHPYTSENWIIELKSLI